jgi:hypothetical protein
VSPAKKQAHNLFNDLQTFIWERAISSPHLPWFLVGSLTASRNQINKLINKREACSFMSLHLHRDLHKRVNSEEMVKAPHFYTFLTKVNKFVKE